VIAGRQFWLWRAVDDEGEVLDLQSSTGTMSAQRGIEDKALSTMMPTSNIFKDDNFECVERGDTIGIT
jgi:hypothetical protein